MQYCSFLTFQYSSSYFHNSSPKANNIFPSLSRLVHLCMISTIFNTRFVREELLPVNTALHWAPISFLIFDKCELPMKWHLRPEVSFPNPSVFLPFAGESRLFLNRFFLWLFLCTIFQRLSGNCFPGEVKHRVVELKNYRLFRGYCELFHDNFSKHQKICFYLPRI